LKPPLLGVGGKRIFRKKPRQGWWISHLAVSGPAVGFTPSRFTCSNTPRHKVGGLQDIIRYGQICADIARYAQI